MRQRIIDATRSTLVEIEFITTILTLAFVLLLSFSGCASIGRLNRTAQILVHEAILQSEASRCTIRPAPCLTAEQFRAVNVKLNKIAVSGREFTRLQIAGTATVKDATILLTTVTTVLTSFSQNYPTGTIDTIIKALEQYQSAIVALIDKLQKD